MSAVVAVNDFQDLPCKFNSYCLFLCGVYTLFDVFLKEISFNHNTTPCFQYNIAIANFLVSQKYDFRFNDAIGQSTVPMYFYAKIPKHD